ncbi:MAG: LysR family transcriptional regulator [Geminicoccaceae bacterium]
MRNIDTTLLRSFVTVAETGGMTAAARQLNLTQAAVSQQIKRLEEQLQCRLFERDRKDFAITAAGERLMGKAQRMLALNDDIWTTMVRPEFEGEVHLGVPHDIVTHLMPPVLRRFDRAWPRVQITFDCSATQTLLGRLEAGELDLTLTTEHHPPRDGVMLMREPLVWVGAAGGKAHLRDPLPVSLGDHHCAFRPVVSEAIASLGRDWRSVCDHGSMQAMEATLSADLAISAMLRCAVARNLELIPPSAGLPPLPNFHINMYIRKGAVSAAATELARHIRDTLSGEALVSAA